MSQIKTEEQIVTKTRKKLKPPVQYKVLLHNDDYTTMEFVVYVLQSVFRKSPSEATQ
ncbi:MAG: ATP-dependent Clp protease adaptor ClpS, partial [SAR324 cluster bacterium]|nr:ATP-dependent Clp protease adaptor ClpS [SAR324 cluster bacterium]